MKFLKPVRIISSSGNITDVDNFLKDYPLQIEIFYSEFMRIEKEGFFILDFGKEVSGGVRLFTRDICKDYSIRLRFGESVGEACSEIGEKGSTNDHSSRDFCIKVPPMSDNTFGETGFRFVRIDFKGDFWLIRNVVAAVNNDEREEIGYFKCDDEIINKIFDTAAYTLRLNLHNGVFWDGVKRDRLCWIGDSYPEMKAALCLYDDKKEILNSLKFTYDATPGTNWMNGIPTYNVWWLLILFGNYRYDGNKENIKQYRNYIFDLLKAYDNCIKDDGTVAFDMYFIDWPSHYEGDNDLVKKNDEYSGVVYLLKYCIKRIKEIFAEFCDKDILNISDKLLSKINKNKLVVKKYKQIAALAVLNDEKNGMEELLLHGGPEGLSTFQSYFILSAISEFGKYDEALQILKEYYGGMLSVGATTFFEDFDLEWLKDAAPITRLPVGNEKDIHGDYGKFCYKGFRHSLCHGWSCGVIPYLVENVAGIKCIDHNHYSFNPHLSFLKKVDCAFPTPYGLIKVKIENINGKLTKHIDCPKEITLVSE